MRYKRYEKQALNSVINLAVVPGGKGQVTAAISWVFFSRLPNANQLKYRQPVTDTEQKANQPQSS
ncbi:MAG: hypothetical protein ACXWT0_14200 [Methylobacter sp.]